MAPLTSGGWPGKAAPTGAVDPPSSGNPRFPSGSLGVGGGPVSTVTWGEENPMSQPVSDRPDFPWAKRAAAPDEQCQSLLTLDLPEGAAGPPITLQCSLVDEHATLIHEGLWAGSWQAAPASHLTVSAAPQLGYVVVVVKWMEGDAVADAEDNNGDHPAPQVPWVVCPGCFGMAAPAGVPLCGTCGGSGQVPLPPPDVPPGLTEADCPDCPDAPPWWPPQFTGPAVPIGEPFGGALRRALDTGGMA